MKVEDIRKIPERNALLLYREHWAALDHDEAVKLWEELGKFVTWLDGRHLTNLADPNYRLPGCWYRHPIAVEELAALIMSYWAAYDTRSAQA